MKKNDWFRFVGFVLMISLACTTADQQKQTYLKEIEDWHQKRNERLRQPKSWLSLAGLFWLKTGENSFGSDRSNDIIFPPQKAPAKMGRFILKDSKVFVEINPGIKVLHQGKIISSIEMQDDQSGAPTELAYGPLRWIVIKREDRFAVRLWDTEHDQLKQFKGIERFPVDEKWRVEAQLEVFDSPWKLPVPTVLGTISEESTPGVLIFQIEGKTYRLLPIAESVKSPLFIIFADKTNGLETYGAGRFLYADPPDENGKTILDFNKAYNPPCVFSPYATCPLPPDENYLPLRVTAGEKNYAGYHHK
ncbi:MAG: DUF1684 domain-containing protein [Calditrichia bacterium]